MGTESSKEETKTIDSTGNINNNLVLEGPVDIKSTEVIIFLGIICLIKIMEFGVFLYKYHSKKVKKNYDRNNALNSVLKV